MAARSSSSKAAPHDEQEPSEDLPGNRVPKVNLIKSPKWPIKSSLKGVHRQQARAAFALFERVVFLRKLTEEPKEHFIMLGENEIAAGFRDTLLQV